jgi:pyruvate,orthophosphate dikinase
VDLGTKQFHLGGQSFKEGDWVTLNGTKGNVYAGQLAMMAAGEENQVLMDFLKICDAVRRLGVRTNAETTTDAAKARAFGAEGIGLFRTEHMFYGKGSDEPLFILRKMIMSKSEEERKRAVDELFPYVKRDIKGTMEIMDGLPVVVRLLDPPLHEFVPESPDKRQALAQSLGISMEELSKRADGLHESNPMMGHRGVRLGITYPEVAAMQVRAVFESAAELIKEGKKPHPEIMIPVVCDVNEIKHQLEICKQIYKEVCAKFGLKGFKHMIGTMIEIPRAALLSGQIAEVAEFFSFGTNDLTQTCLGMSRDDSGSFLPPYQELEIVKTNPFASIDQAGVGQLMKIAVEKGRSTRPNIKLGICGEHGGDPDSVKFCHKLGLTYVSCSPFRVPVARLAAAQAALEEEDAKKAKKK